MRLAVLAAAGLLLSACWQVSDPVVTEGVRVDGLADGLYRRPDGTELMIRWNPAAERYDVGMNGGSARAAPLGDGLFLVDYADAVRLLVVASARDGALVIHSPDRAAEQRLARTHGLKLRPGPVLVADGPAPALRAYASDVAALAGTTELGEGERLVRVR